MSENSKSILLIESSQDFFSELVNEGLEKRKVKVAPAVTSYLSSMLNHYLDARNLFDQDPILEDGTRNPTTLAETFMVAQNSDLTTKVGMLKKLADRTLYVSGFFGDSLSRKLIDLDYYAQIGGASYATLAGLTRQDTLTQVYKVFSYQFLDFVEVLTYISEQTAVQSDQSVLKLYDRYIKTGSTMAKEKLAQLGVSVLPADQLKLGKSS